ncbi:hypothetical protein [Nannocystis radixulma]|uniref:Lipoprotein n=1 Tax=Nannocystis radixulma TaxID=2995305 RepID=A0ABT5B6W6_9BACT|nr:hypothetical protein [Nannocystis radixulma]MDC0669849.1 hypothetical protein [Nannocystis radixulma]
MRRNLRTTWLAIVAAGCNYHSGGMTAGATDSAADQGSETSTDTSAEETTDTSGTTGEMPVNYCHGFQVAAAKPFLALYREGGEKLVDGSTWPLECDRDGAWMFGLYPSLGGWDPMANEVMFTVEVDVDGFDAEGQHFFSDEVDYHIGCEQSFAGSLGVAPVSLPAGVTDPAQLDGKPATLHVTVLAGDMELRVDASVTLSAPAEEVLRGCVDSP